jgi:hypothetical protein
MSRQMIQWIKDEDVHLILDDNQREKATEHIKKKRNEWTYLIAGSFVDGSGLDECIIQVEENGINPLQVVVMMVTVSSSIKGTRFRSCCFHHAMHGRLQITVWDCLQSSCQYLCTSSCVPPTPPSRGILWRHVLRDRLTKTKGSLLINNNRER